MLPRSHKRAYVRSDSFTALRAARLGDPPQDVLALPAPTFVVGLATTRGNQHGNHHARQRNYGRNSHWHDANIQQRMRAPENIYSNEANYCLNSLCQPTCHQPCSCETTGKCCENLPHAVTVPAARPPRQPWPASSGRTRHACSVPRRNAAFDSSFPCRGVAKRVATPSPPESAANRFL